MGEYIKGLRAGLPVGLGYFSVSIAFGVQAAQAGLPLLAAVAISMTNLTSAGQLGGLTIIAESGTFFAMALNQLVINLRYALMSVSLSQKLEQKVTGLQRLLIAFGNTDELYAIAMGQSKKITAKYFYGLMTLPYICWSGGTLLGAAAGQILPANVLSALGVALFAMFIAVIVPAMKRSGTVALVVVIAASLSCLFTYTPGLKNDFSIIICAVAAAAVGALVHPVEEASAS